MVYKWKTPGFYSMSADTAAQEIKRIERVDGAITPVGIVDASRPTEAVLHTCFDWNDATAAEQWRQQQARALIRNIVEVHVAEPEKTEPVIVRAFVHVDGEERNVYRQLNVVVNEENGRDRLLQTAMRELSDFREKYKSLVEFAAIFAMIDELLRV